MSYNSYIARRCPYCGYRTKLKINGTFAKHKDKKTGAAVCAGTGSKPTERITWPIS